MTHCKDCDAIGTTFCLPRLSDPTITGCTMSDYLKGLIPWDAIQIEHTICQQGEKNG